MPASSWRKRLAVWKNRFYLYPQPEPLPHTRWFWIAMGLVTAMATTFAAFFIFYLFAQHDAFVSPAEDLGIMTQALWNVTHGSFLHQTICNALSDTNCYGLNGFSRFAIHFEPILLPVSLLYALLPNAKFLFVLQTLVVASGAFPAFWLARLRLRNEWAGVLVAALYLLFPELQQAEAFYFHAVTLTAALLLFTLYFMYTRRTVWVFVCALLTLACKEELPIVIAMLGLWSIVFQQRTRVGLGLIGIAVAWIGLDLLVFHFFSPVGHPLLASRYAYLGKGPVEILRTIVLHPLSLIKAHVLETEHNRYIRLLLAPVAYLPLLAPWVLIIAVPSIALNLLSSDRNQYLNVFQYNAEIVPVLIFATIEALVLLFWATQWIWEHRYDILAQTVFADRFAPGQAEIRATNPPARNRLKWLQPAALLLVLCVLILTTLRLDQPYGVLPFSRGFSIPPVSAHNMLAQRFIHMVPSNASVSAQDNLVPHMSNRNNIYLFPYGTGTADYVFLDIASNSIYPYNSTAMYREAVNNLILHKNYGVVAAQDGYLLLKRGLPSPGLSPLSPTTDGSEALPNLPSTFCSFIHVPDQQVATPMQVNFKDPHQQNEEMSLVGYQLELPDTFSIITRYFQMTTYWRVNQANLPALNIKMSLMSDSGQNLFDTEDFSAIHWCPTSTWGTTGVIAMTTSLLYIGNVPNSRVHVGITLLPNTPASATIHGKTQGLPFQIVHAPGTVAAMKEGNTLQLQTFTVAWSSW